MGLELATDIDLVLFGDITIVAGHGKVEERTGYQNGKQSVLVVVLVDDLVDLVYIEDTGLEVGDYIQIGDFTVIVNTTNLDFDNGSLFTVAWESVAVTIVEGWDLELESELGEVLVKESAGDRHHSVATAIDELTYWIYIGGLQLRLR